MILNLSGMNGFKFELECGKVKKVFVAPSFVDMNVDGKVIRRVMLSMSAAGQYGMFRYNEIIGECDVNDANGLERIRHALESRQESLIDELGVDNIIEGWFTDE